MNNIQTLHLFCVQIAIGSIAAQQQQKERGFEPVTSYISPYHFMNLDSTKNIPVNDVAKFMDELPFLKKRPAGHIFGTFEILPEKLPEFLETYEVEECKEAYNKIYE